MGIAKIYNQKQSGLGIKGIIEDYYVYAGEKVSAGDFVEFINGVAGQKTETSSDTAIKDTGASAAYYISAVALDDTRVFIAHTVYENSIYVLYGVVCSVSGTSITVGIDTLINDRRNSEYPISTILLQDGRIFITHIGSNADNSSGTYYLWGDLCEVSNTVITVKRKQILVADTVRCNSSKLLPNGSVFIAHRYGTSNYLYGMIVEISGVTITKKTDTKLSSTTQSSTELSTVVLDDRRVFIINSHSSNFRLYGMICTINGTTITADPNTSLCSNTYSSRALSSDKIGVDKLFISHERDNYLYGIVCTINDTTISKGTDTHIFNYVNISDSSTLTIGTDKVLVISINNTTEYKMFGVICDIENNAITKNTPTIMNSNSYTGSRTSPIMLRDNVFVAHSYSSKYYLYAQIFGIDKTNNIPTNNVTIKEYETQVRKATTSDIYGVAKTSGVGGDNTGHKDIVSIYTVEQTLASLPVGTLVKDTSSTFLGEPIIWKIADVNHEGYPSNSVTLISDKILAMRCFDAKEPNNTNSDIQELGNNRYSVSNIRQWLNSDAKAGQWYSAQHEYDAPPSSDNVSVAYDVPTNPYDTNAGFLNGFSQNFKNALLETTLTVALDTVTNSGGSENVTDKMFLASTTEVGLKNENNIAEGSLLPIFSDNLSRIANVTAKGIEDNNYPNASIDENTAWSWRLRTLYSGTVVTAYTVYSSGALSGEHSYLGGFGIRPLCNISSSVKVSSTPDKDGCYNIIF